MSPYESSESARRDGEGNGPDSLQSAILHVGRNARTTGEEPFGIRRSAAIAQRAALVEWAESRGLILTPSFWDGKASIGGSEHDIWEDNGQYWKVTRPDRFGWTVLPGPKGMPVVSEATPLEYLERWQNSGELFNDPIELRGVSETDEGVQVIISQTYIKGPYPNKSQVRNYMEGYGFEVIQGFSVGSETDSTFYHSEENIAVFDASSDNFILSQGMPIPIDVIVLEPGAKLTRQLRALLRK